MSTPKRSSEPVRIAGRSFTEPERPLGQGVLDRTTRRGGDEDGGAYGRAAVHPKHGHGLADRAKAISVLRKAEELMASGNPPGDTERGRRRALALACRRCGVRAEEYAAAVAGDEELRALHAAVLDAARRGATHLG